MQVISRKMHFSLVFSVSGAVLITPIHFLSVEHTKLQEKFGKEKGTKIGEILGIISGWGFFLFWIGIWVSSQPRFCIPIFNNLLVMIPVLNFSIPFIHIIISVSFLSPGIWFAINGVKETSLRVAETHRTEKIVTRGVYSIIRHPQYFGGLLSHVGISFLLSAWYSLLLSPLMIILVYVISKKEEEELIREFGEEYLDYKKKTPMLVPKTFISSVNTPS